MPYKTGQKYIEGVIVWLGNLNIFKCAYYCPLCRDIHGVLKRFLNLAVKWELLNKNPVLMVSSPRVSFKIPEIWSGEQVRKFLDSLEGDRWEAIYSLACTGMHKGAVLGTSLKRL